jgi:hypothetical protein
VERHAVADLEGRAAGTSAAVHELLAGFPPTLADALPADDRRALDGIRSGIETADANEPPVGPAMSRRDLEDSDAWRAAVDAGGDALQRRLEAAYTAAAGSLDMGGAETLTRPEVLERLGSEADRARRRELFLALGPLWRAVNADDAGGSPYRAFFASLGADLDELNVRLDVTARPGRPPVPVAFTTFGARPHRRPDGTWSPGEPVILETLTAGGFGDL